MRETPHDVSLTSAHSLSFVLPCKFKMPWWNLQRMEPRCTQTTSDTFGRWELTRGQVWSRCRIRPNYWTGELVMSIYILMDCKWFAGIMTEWKQSTSYPWALFRPGMDREQLFWANKAYLSKYGVPSLATSSLFKWDSVVFASICYWVKSPSSLNWTSALFALNDIVEAWSVWADTLA